MAGNYSTAGIGIERARSLAWHRVAMRGYGGADPVGFVISMNLHRRHLNESQRACVAAKVSTREKGERSDIGRFAGFARLTQAAAAALLNTSERSIRSAKQLEREPPSYCRR
jgi:hypothetical protein